MYGDRSAGLVPVERLCICWRGQTYRMVSLSLVGDDDEDDDDAIPSGRLRWTTGLTWRAERDRWLGIVRWCERCQLLIIATCWLKCVFCIFCVFCCIIFCVYNNSITFHCNYLADQYQIIIKLLISYSKVKKNILMNLKRLSLDIIIIVSSQQQRIILIIIIVGR